MQNTLHDVSVSNCKQIVQATLHCLDKAAAYCAENDVIVDELIETQLHYVMRPLRYQIFAVALHSIGAMKALETGEFIRPPSYPEQLNYTDMQNHLRRAFEGLSAFTPERVNGLTGGKVTVKTPDWQIPFSIEDFILSFSHPNLYFHAATTYGILRRKGIPLEKRDFLGEFRLVA